MAQRIEGKVVSVDAAGNLMTDITAEKLELAPSDDTVTICCDEHETTGIYTTDHSQPEMTFIAVIGESGHLQLTIVGESAHLMLGIRVGEDVVVAWT